MPWQQISVNTTAGAIPELSDLFSKLGAVSVTYMDAADQSVYEPAPGEAPVWLQTRVIALFELDINLDLVKSIIDSECIQTLLENWQQEILQDQVWERCWMEYFQPMKFGQRLWVCPTGQQRVEAETVCMTLDPGLAFGTGTHPTTALCLQWLADHDLRDKIIIDYGCGSGILAVAALLLGAKQVHAVDIDPQALTATRENAIKNDVQNNMNTYLPEQFPIRSGDIVLANILAKALIKLSEQLSCLVKQKGQLVLSGVLTEQAKSVADAYEAHLNINTVRIKEGWCLLVGSK